MSNPRIYSSTPLTPHSTVTLDGGTHRHVAQVLRLKKGAEITLFDGSGVQFPATLEQVERKQVSATLGEATAHNIESPLSIHLFQGISKGERMDHVMQKATELGVSAITPLFTERTVVKLEPKRLQKKLEHWHGVIIAACEQSGRNRLPILHPPQALHTLSPPSPTIGFLLNPTASTGLGEQPQPESPVSVLIGPEGGLSDQEIENAEANGWQGVQLGPRILRTETAAVATLTALQLLWGDL